MTAMPNPAQSAADHPFQASAQLSDSTRIADRTQLSDRTCPAAVAPKAIPPHTTGQWHPSHASRSSSSASIPAASDHRRRQQHAIRDATEFRQAADALTQAISTAVLGKETSIRRCVTALIAGGHILLEDTPGTGKTQLARALANALEASYSRIQFTPDMLPGDVTGITVYRQRTGDFAFRPGPIFASIVLADEVNRSSPKTQSALLEVMEERQVTVDGARHRVPQPFMVIATQNPYDQAGTYRLPEAQLDRFFITLSLGAPDHAASITLLKQASVIDRAALVTPVLDGEGILALRSYAETIHIGDQVLEYIVRLVEATRHHELIACGASIRAGLALVRGARVCAGLEGRDYVTPDDVRDLAVSVLAHRIVLKSEAICSATTSRQIIMQLLDNVPAPQSAAIRRGPR